MGATKIFVFICLLQCSTFKITSCQDENDDRANWIDQEVTQNSLKQLKLQAQLLVKNSQALATGPLKNAQESFMLAIVSIENAAKNFKLNTAKKMLNNTIQQIFIVTKNVNSLASGKGVNASSCFKNTTVQIYNLTQSFMGQMGSCAIDKVTEGLAMINSNLQFITTILNETTAFPINMNTCLESSSIKTQYSCLKDLVSRMTYLLFNVPVSITSRVNDLHAYINLFPVSLTLCATKTTFAATSEGAGIAIGMTTCVLEKILGLSK